MATNAEVAALAARYEPEIARGLQSVRKHLATHFPRGFELVYDNYNALACGFSPTERASDVVVSVAAYPRWVTLFFLNGASLPDPQKVLSGSGSRVRSVRLSPVSRLNEPAVQRLLSLVVAQSKAGFAEAPARATIIKSVSAKQRPRRAPAAAKK